LRSANAAASFVPLSVRATTGSIVTSAACIIGRQSPWFRLPARTARYAATCARIRPCSIMKSCSVPSTRNTTSGRVSAASTAACPD
jgi:hypothetical protein